MDTRVVFVLSEEIERRLCLDNVEWFRSVIDPLLEEMDGAAGLPAWS